MALYDFFKGPLADDGYGGILDPRIQLLSGMAQGFAKAGAPSPYKQSTLGALNMGLGGGMQGLLQGQQMLQHKKLFDAQVGEAERKKREQEEQAAALSRLAQDPRFAGMSDLLRIAPQAAIARAMPTPKAPDGFTLGPDQVRYDADGRVVAKGDAGDKAPTTRKVREGNEEVTQEYVNGQWREVARGPAFSDKPLVNIDNRQEGKFAETVGKELGDQYAGLLRADMNAPATIAKYQRLGSLLGQVNTGKFKGATTDLKAAAKSLGIDLTALGIPDDVAPAQAARALSNQIALELRNPAGGAGMPGALSDKDREFLVQSIPGLENDPQAIGKMIEYRVKLAQREQEVAKRARAYRRKHNRFDEGFFDELAEWSAKNPLFPDRPELPKPQSNAPAPNVRTIDFGSLKSGR